MNNLILRVLFFTLFVMFTTKIVNAQNNDYEIFAIKFASTYRPLPLSVNVLGAPKDLTVDPSFSIFLIKGKNGKNILVDAGFLRNAEQVKDFGIQVYARPDSALLPLGVRSSDISDIILTHPHWDHMGGIDLFENAHLWIQEKDYEYFVGTAWQEEGKNGGFNKEDVLKLVNRNIAGKLTLVNGDGKQIFPGITVYTGSQHTFGSQYVLVNSGSDKIILASDNAFTYYNIEHLMSAPTHATFDTKAYIKAMTRMKKLSSELKFIIPGHDNLLFSRFPKINENVIKIK
ncbi:glyoxylase-like metal-dependent hydrolase (beta-lactamase superfamily II) [Pedobacter cryoconitis]|uniref:Glyoxylase-like metal-dependent hydrolase (Beta-lactamase superfamily II) n=1 Tax=Pedobacter cryoconitis TaxID=188932 RepID=A0A7W9DK58_9SPHI|nr:N-acyl homoserine lactonase family protein [Pedobacter cryoconitis]MBB5621891.1 glyoxylase-like metal-dependent hydrolase (beta-lactamase superfamily II) [Pedobacter cryoconitis]